MFPLYSEIHDVPTEPASSKRHHLKFTKEDTLEAVKIVVQMKACLQSLIARDGFPCIFRGSREIVHLRLTAVKHVKMIRNERPDRECVEAEFRTLQSFGFAEQKTHR